MSGGRTGWLSSIRVLSLWAGHKGRPDGRLGRAIKFF